MLVHAPQEVHAKIDTLLCFVFKFFHKTDALKIDILGECPKQHPSKQTCILEGSFRETFCFVSRYPVRLTEGDFWMKKKVAH